MLTQYKSHSLDRHITTTWRMSTLLGNYVTPVPAQQRLGPRWFLGSADAIYQSLNLIYDEQPDYIVVFGADHVYRMDPRQMVAPAHRRRRRRPRSPASASRARRPSAFGVIDAGADGLQVERFLEKPADPPGLPDDPEQVYASMGNYVFTTNVAARRAAPRTPRTRTPCTTWAATSCRCWSSSGQAQVYDFDENDVPGADRARPRLLARRREPSTPTTTRTWTWSPCTRSSTSTTSEWPIYTHTVQLPPAKFVAGGIASESMVAPGCIITGQVTGSVLSPGVVVEEGAVVQGSILHDNVRIGRGAVVRRAILDKNIVVPPRATVGVNPERDRELYHVSANGVIALGKGQQAL